MLLRAAGPPSCLCRAPWGLLPSPVNFPQSRRRLPSAVASYSSPEPALASEHAQSAAPAPTFGAARTSRAAGEAERGDRETAGPSRD